METPIRLDDLEDIPPFKEPPYIDCWNMVVSIKGMFLQKMANLKGLKFLFLTGVFWLRETSRTYGGGFCLVLDSDETVVVGRACQIQKMWRRKCETSLSPAAIEDEIFFG